MRSAVLDAANTPSSKNWLAPQPAAWAALAALWVTLAVLDSLLNGAGTTTREDKLAAAPPRQSPALLAFYQHAGVVEAAR